VISGLEEVSDETWAQTEERVRTFVNGLKDGLGTKLNIQRCHRLGRFAPNARFPRRCIAKLALYKEKEEILAERRKLAGSNIYLDDDLPRTMRERRDQLRRFALPMARERNVVFRLKFPYTEVRVGDVTYTPNDIDSAASVGSSGAPPARVTSGANNEPLGTVTSQQPSGGKKRATHDSPTTLIIQKNAPVAKMPRGGAVRGGGVRGRGGRGRAWPIGGGRRGRGRGGGASGGGSQRSMKQFLSKDWADEDSMEDEELVETDADTDDTDTLDRTLTPDESNIPA
jgi:hypothetical protein